MKSTEKWGVDVETAVELALKDLKAERDEVEVEVLEESSSGFLGIGSKLAKVKVSIKESADEPKEKATFDDIDAILAGLPENTSQQLPDEVRAEYDKFEAEEIADAEAAEALHAKERKSEKKGKRNRKKYSLSIEDSQLEEVKKMDPAEGHVVETFLRDIAEQMGLDLDFG